MAYPVIGTFPALAIWLVTIGGFSIGLQAISLQSWLQANAPNRREAMQALFVSLTQAAIGIGALAGGVVVDHSETAGAMLLGGFVSLATLIAAMLHQKG